MMDITQNSIEAKAETVRVLFEESGDLIKMEITDNGCGMSSEVLAKAQDPFYTDPKKHAARKVGFGLPFLIQACQSCGGEFSIKSVEGEGTDVNCSFGRDNIDTPPVGGLVSTVVALMTMDREYELEFHRKRDGDQYSVTRGELLEALGELETVDSIILARDYVTLLEENLATEN